VHARLFCHLKQNGVLFLALPLRCVDSPLVGRKRFESLLQALGAVDVIPPRVTPKLIFYVLKGSIPESESDSVAWPARIKGILRLKLHEDTKIFFSRDIAEISSDPLKHFSLRFPSSWLS
jgi:hypothetical protein